MKRFSLVNFVKVYGLCTSVLPLFLNLKTFVGVMLIRTLRRTLLQIFREINLVPKVIVKSIVGPDDNFERNGLK